MENFIFCAVIIARSKLQDGEVSQYSKSRDSLQFKLETVKLNFEIMHLVRTQHFPKN